MDKKNDTLMTFIVDKDKDTRLFYFHVFDTKEEVPTYYSHGDYLYAYEMNDHIEIGKTDFNHVKSMTQWATGRVAILGPIRDSERVIHEIESFIFDFKTGENPGTYKFESLEEFIGNPYKQDAKDLGIFQIIQLNFKDGFKGKDHVLHSLGNGNEVVRDLIIPDKHARITVVVFETKDGILRREESTAVV